MKHFLLALDEDQLDLLIDLLTAAIALAEHHEGAWQATRMMSVGAPILEDLRAARAQL